MEKSKEVVMQHEPSPEFEVRKATTMEKLKGRLFGLVYPTLHKVITFNERRAIRNALEKNKHQRLIAPPREVEVLTEDVPLSVYRQVENHLKSGKSLTVLECWRLFHTTELRKIVSRIRQRDGSGSVKDSWEEMNKRRYKRYYC